MSNPYQNKAENANGDDDVLDLEVEFLEEEAAFLDEMREYYAPGGLYQQQLKMLIAMMMMKLIS